MNIDLYCPESVWISVIKLGEILKKQKINIPAIPYFSFAYMYIFAILLIQTDSSQSTLKLKVYTIYNVYYACVLQIFAALSSSQILLNSSHILTFYVVYQVDFSMF